MNDEYLWNKTGTDPEIEALEKQLAVFRTAVNKAPAIAGTTAEARQPFFAGIRLQLAFAGFASLLVALVAAWFTLISLPGSAPVSITFADQAQQYGTVAIPDAPSTRKRIVKQAPGPERLQQWRQVDIGRESGPITGDGGASPDPLQTAALTVEERQVYEKLMLALSITSSSLKQVQDRIDGEDPVEIPLPATESLERSN